MGTMTTTSSALLNLPPEIKLQIWEYAFGYQHIPLYTSNDRTRYSSYEEIATCEACKDKSPQVSNYESLLASASIPKIDNPPPYRRYMDCLNSLYVCKSVFSEAIKIFQSTLTFHIKSPEAIALVRQSAPKSLRERVTKLVIYIHFGDFNQLIWCARLFELEMAFPAVKHIRISYHMRPPVSYDNLQDVVFLYLPILTLPVFFHTPHLVEKETDTSPKIHDGPITIPTTDVRPGLTVYTSYMRNEPLFEANFLGLITTEDAIDEHTSVVRDLFYDPVFIATSHQLLFGARAEIEASVAAQHPPWPSTNKRFDDPTLPHNQPFLSLLLAPQLQRELLRVARRHEKPWFEKLQRRRIVEIYVEQGGMTKQEAEELLDRQLAAMPEGHGIEEFMDRLMSADDGDEEGMTAALAMGGQENWPASWQQEFEQQQESPDA